MAQYLAKPCGDCCLQAVKHSGTPVGGEVDIGGIKSYVTYPPSKSTDKIILFYTDVYGPWYLNNQLLVDFFAEHGYLVIAPDYFEGDKLEDLLNGQSLDVVASGGGTFDWSSWVTTKRERATPIIETFEAAVKAQFAAKSHAAVAYCFGAYDVIKAVSSGVAVAGAIAHPALVTEKDLHSLKEGAPIFFSCAETDGTFSAEDRHKAEAILAANKVNYHFQLFSGVEHGFAIRGDMENENIRWAKEQSAWGILGWFDRFLK